MKVVCGVRRHSVFFYYNFQDRIVPFRHCTEMTDYRINFIANTSSCSLSFNVPEGYHVASLPFLPVLLAPFACGLDLEKGNIQVSCYQQNSEAFRKRFSNILPFLGKKFPALIELKKYFNEILADNEFFYIYQGTTLNDEEARTVLHKLMLMKTPYEEYQLLKESEDVAQKLKRCYKIIPHGDFPNNFGEKERTKRECRYCHRAYPNVTFKKKGHTISEGIGNDILITYDECDECNDRFGRIIEQNFINYLDILRLILGIDGKKGLTKSKGNDYEMVRNAGNNLAVNIYNVDDQDADCHPDPEDIRLRLHSYQKMRPQNIYKCLVKYAVGTLDENELSHLNETTLWLYEETPREGLMLPKLARAYSPGIRQQPRITIFARRPEVDEQLPHIVALLEVLNLNFMYIVPFSTADTADFTDEETYEKYWNYFAPLTGKLNWEHIAFDQTDERDIVTNLRFLPKVVKVIKKPKRNNKTNKYNLNY